VTCTRHDGSQVAVRFANAQTMRGDRVSDYLIFADVIPLRQE
jgi:hypothetical protein